MINVLFSGNDKVFDGILTCVLSILKRTSTREPFRFYIFTMDVSRLKEDYIPVSDAKTDFLRRVIKEYNTENEVKKIDVTKIYRSEFAGCPNENAYCSPYTLIRLFVDLVPGMPVKLLYLDVDILFNRDIRLLYDTDISGYEYAAARDHYGKYLIRPDYINAGVLLLNTEEIVKTGLMGKSRALLRQKKLPFADQSAIFRSTRRKKILAQRFNDQKFLHGHTVARHFSKRLFWLPYPHMENIKPWMTERIHKKFGYRQFDDVFSEYLKLKEEYEKEEYEKEEKEFLCRKK